MLHVASIVNILSCGRITKALIRLCGVDMEISHSIFLVFFKKIGTAYEILLLLHMHGQLSSGSSGLGFGLGLHLRPYFAYASSKGSG